MDNIKPWIGGILFAIFLISAIFVIDRFLLYTELAREGVCWRSDNVKLDHIRTEQDCDWIEGASWEAYSLIDRYRLR